MGVRQYPTTGGQRESRDAGNSMVSLVQQSVGDVHEIDRRKSRPQSHHGCTPTEVPLHRGEKQMEKQICGWNKNES